MKELNILFGLSESAGNKLQRKLQMIARQSGYEMRYATRYRKEGIRQFVQEHPEYSILILQESMQSNFPYTAEEISELMDDRHLNIIISLDRKHKGNFFMKVLYASGILNALYEDDASAENIFRHIIYLRTRKECRAYYDIANLADVARTLNVMDEEKLQQYIAYMEDSGSEAEVLQKFQYLLRISGKVESLYLVEHMPGHLKKMVELDGGYQSLYAGQGKKKKRGLFK